MPTLNDALIEAVQTGVYRDRRAPDEYVRFTDFGSRACPAEIYDCEGNLIRQQNEFMDSEEGRKSYVLVPEEDLPQPLKGLLKKSTASL